MGKRPASADEFRLILLGALVAAAPAKAAHPSCHGDNMRFPWLTRTLVGAAVACNAQAAFSAEDQYALAGRWELTSSDLPITPRRGGSIVIDSGTIKIKMDCNEETLSYSVKGDELSAVPTTTTLVSCYPPRGFYERRLVFETVMHARYQVDGDVLRLFSLSDAPFDYSLEFHRVR